MLAVHIITFFYLVVFVWYTNADDVEEFRSMVVKRKSPPACGEASDQSVRMLIPGFISDDDIDWLKDVVKRGMSNVTNPNGPTIMDPDLGLVLAPGGKVFKIEEDFSEAELSRYGEMLKKVYDEVLKIHNLPKGVLYHTAPTFIARLRPSEHDKDSKHVHDEYWHLHCDKNNTEHYDYSALVYLSDYGQDFDGGLFEFHDDDKVTALRPKKGSLLTFSSGIETAHRVNKVTRGERLAWSLWFTCDKSKQFLKSRQKVDHDEL